MAITSETKAGKIQRLREESEANPDDPKIHLKLGTAQVKAGDALNGEKSLRRALELDENCVGAWINLGSVLLERLDYQGCVDVNRKAAACDPTLVAAHYNEGLGQLYLGNSKEMVECFRRVLKLEPNHPGGNYHMAVGLNGQGEPHQAIPYYNRSLELGYPPQPDFMRAMDKVSRAAPTIELGPGAPSNGESDGN